MDEEGADGELGLELREFVFRDSRFDLAGFTARGKFGGVLGGRAAFDVTTRIGDLGLAYELSNHDQDGFTADNDDLPQHRMRASWRFADLGEWQASAWLEASLWDDERAVSAGFFLQRSL
jgi:hypothetical protein